MATNVELAKEKAQIKADLNANVTAWEEESKDLDLTTKEGGDKLKAHSDSQEALYERIGLINVTILNQVDAEAGISPDN
tara:strand:+ start:2544 stop:2780 length:237 start_codon:yes stop_codon:yes gene_type:complete